MSYSCPNSIDGFGFPVEDIADAVRRKGLLSMEIEFSHACNFACPYCYNHAHDAGLELTSKEIDDVLTQARDLGARKIIVLGGEPMIYPEIHGKIDFIRRLGMQVEMFTNGSCMTPESAAFMFEHGVAVVLKMNSFNPELQNRMAGRGDANEIIHTAFRNLKTAGYPAAGKRLAISAVICEQNIGELPDMWRWARKQCVEPYFEMITPQGGATDTSVPGPPAARQQALFNELARIDRDEFGHEWAPQPPLVGNRCLRHQFSCVTTANGDVLPCVGVTIPLGNIRDCRLAEILESSEVMERLRDYRRTIKGPCAACDKADQCYGCRGAAYQLTGDYLASDPMCWRNLGKPIEHLPASAAAYLPQQPPMRFIDEIVEIGERNARLRTRIHPDNVFVDEDGTLDEAVYAELIAQGVAALEGFVMTPEERARHQGFLTGIKNCELRKSARVGDELEVWVEKTGRFGGFGIVEGEVRRDGSVLARAQVNIYLASDAS